jgi:hypothetical protein
MTRGWRLGLVLALAAPAGCKTVARGEHYEAKLVEAFKEHGHTVAVRCPDAIPLGHVSTNRFECHVVADNGSAARFLVKLNHDGGFDVDVVPGTDTPPTRNPDFKAAPDTDDDPWN